MNLIPSGEVNFHPHSFGEHQVRLFWWNGQLFRGISSEYAPFFKRLFDDNVIQHMIQKDLLIDSEPTSFALDSYEVVSVTARLVSYPILMSGVQPCLSKPHHSHRSCSGTCTIRLYFRRCPSHGICSLISIAASRFSSIWDLLFL